MRFTKSYIKTLKETPKEAEIASHKLMLRAGMIKKLASGIYAYLPLGYRTIRKIENIIREEMDRAGALELLMPVVQPAELWQESGRWDVMGPEMLRLKDRHERDFVLSPTQEEMITAIVKSDISSYKSLPLNLYHIQTKFRDERRPRFGLMRGREFTMKDAYSFHTSQESLDEEFLNMRDTYSRIFTRCGLKFRPVDADSGNIGGSGSQEFQVLAESGEDEIIYSDASEYAANIEKAVSELINPPKEELKEVELIHTPDCPTMESLAKYLNVPLERTVKALTYKDMGTDEIYMVLIRGDFEVNEVKLKNILNAVEIEMATDEEIEKIGLKKGYIGVMPVIFASVFMLIPGVIVNALPSTLSIKTTLSIIFGQNHPVYMILYALVIMFFSFFYTALVFDPEKVAENLKQGGGTIPGIRPGEETVEYLEGVASRITWGGGLFLAIISILPYVIFTSMGLPVYFGGTGIIIVVGVALDTIQQIDAHLVMRDYKGFI